jgi:hypothetical protein
LTTDSGKPNEKEVFHISHEGEIIDAYFVSDRNDLGPAGIARIRQNPMFSLHPGVAVARVRDVR